MTKNQSIQENIMYRYLFPFLLFLYSSLGGLWAQTTKTGFKEIYSDGNIKVELQYLLSSNSCQQGGRQHRYEYKVTGRYRPGIYYLNWKMEYIACNGNLYYQQNSLQIGKPNGDDISGGIVLSMMDEKFTADSITRLYYDVQGDIQEKIGSGLIAMPNSKEPKDIESPDKILLGRSADLRVKGGQLGIGAEWNWYTDSCGGDFLGTGESIRVTPKQATTYFIRAEGTYNTTLCARKTIDVDKSSVAPDAITARAKICRGENTVLTVSGGHLGLGADWVWYLNNCGSKRIGTGSTLAIAPTETSTYLVRAEGQMNTTNCVSIVISVFDRSTDPAAVEYNGSSTICEGESIQLKIKGGKLSPDAIWKWYSGSCGGYVLATGSVARLSPSASSTIYVRGEGECNNTACVALKVNVEAKSSRPSAISKPETVYKGIKTTLAISGGRLSPGAEWEWYEGSCGSDNIIGTGAAITIRPRRTTKYFVQAVGKCESGDCITTIITPLKIHGFDRTYLPHRKKFLQLGMGLGAEWVKLPLLTEYTIQTPTGAYTDTSTVTTDGMGLLGEFAFHPVITEWFSLGLIPNFSAGTTTRIFSGGERNLNNGDAAKEEYIYKKINLQLELAFGFEPLKFLLLLNEGIHNINYKATTTGSIVDKVRYEFNQTLKKESVGFGVRFGRYTDANSDDEQSNFDLVYHLTKNYPNNVFDFDFNQLNQWNVGFGLNWWKHSKFKCRFDVYLPATQDEFKLNKINFTNAAYQFSLIWNRNWFY